MPKTVLVVEDNEMNMKVFNDLLEAHDYVPICAGDGYQGLALAREHHPDLILMDIQLPGVSGLDVTRMIKSDPDLADIPIIAVTAFAMKGDAERILASGCEDYLAKPISVRPFMAAIRKYIGEADEPVAHLQESS